MDLLINWIDEYGAPQQTLERVWDNYIVGATDGWVPFKRTIGRRGWWQGFISARFENSTA